GTEVCDQGHVMPSKRREESSICLIPKEIRADWLSGPIVCRVRLISGPIVCRVRLISGPIM
ncbi:hypothetical protein KUCAC02_035746, partial [Chaenocephalus aceratus]